MNKTELRDKRDAGINILRAKFYQNGTRSGWFIARYSISGGWEKYASDNYADYDSCLAACQELVIAAKGKFEIDN